VQSVTCFVNELYSVICSYLYLKSLHLNIYNAFIELLNVIHQLNSSCMYVYKELFSNYFWIMYYMELISMWMQLYIQDLPKVWKPLNISKNTHLKKNVSYKSYRVLCGALHSNIIMTSNSVVKVLWRSPPTF